MNYFTCQDYQIPTVFITALSYAKSANVVTDSRNRARFSALAPAEVSLRFEITHQRCELAGVNFFEWIERVESWADALSVKPAPTTLRLSGYPLFSSLLFALTSLNVSYAQEGRETTSIECDAVFAGVSPAKDAARDRALIFDDAAIEAPKMAVIVNGVRLESCELAPLSIFTLTESSCELTMSFGDATKTLSRDVLDAVLQDENAKIEIEGYGDFYIISANLINDDLTLSGSCLPVSFNETYSKTYRNSALLFPEFEDKTGLKISFLAWHGTQAERLKALQESLGFLIDYPTKTLRSIPESLQPTTDFNAYVNDDLVTEKITSVIWQDTMHTYQAGSAGGAAFGVQSICRVDDDTIAKYYLKYANYMQNYISISLPYDNRIRQHSVINVIKNTKSVPCIVEKYEIDFFSNIMTLECHWI